MLGHLQYIICHRRLGLWLISSLEDSRGSSPWTICSPFDSYHMIPKYFNIVGNPEAVVFDGKLIDKKTTETTSKRSL